MVYVHANLALTPRALDRTAQRVHHRSGFDQRTRCSRSSRGCNYAVVVSANAAGELESSRRWSRNKQVRLAGPVASVDLEEIDHEDERLVRLDNARGT
jgi:hypothetical protein